MKGNEHEGRNKKLEVDKIKSNEWNKLKTVRVYQY